jgi:hypothetical protein
MQRRTRDTPQAAPPTSTIDALSMRHLRFGWWSLLVFLSFGLVLEALHGFKVGWYLEIANSSRRLAWTLAHAHGTLLALINLLFGATLRRLPAWSARARRFASYSLLAATVLLPAGFFLGGLFPYEGDPGLGIFLVPVGGGLLAMSILFIALSCRGTGKD